MRCDRLAAGLFSLRSQVRHDPGINPGTLMAEAARLYGTVPLYDFVSARKSGLLIHALGKISNVQDAQSEASSRLRAGAGARIAFWLRGLRLSLT